MSRAETRDQLLPIELFSGAITPWQAESFECRDLFGIQPSTRREISALILTSFAKQKPHAFDAKFVQFDVVDFYPSITKELLEKALDLAANHVDIPQHAVNIL